MLQNKERSSGGVEQRKRSNYGQTGHTRRMRAMSEWKREFQYLLDRKILTRDELGYLFGQIKSIIDSKKLELQSENPRLREALEKYGKHSQDCRMNWERQMIIVRPQKVICTCGFEQARTGNNKIL